MTVRRLILGLLVLAMSLSSVTAHASSYISNTRQLAAGGPNGGVTTCDSPGNWTYSFQYTGNNVSQVTVRNIASGTAGTNCAGGTLTVTLASSTGVALGTGAGPVGTCTPSPTCTVNIAVSVTAAADNVAAANFVVVGP